MGWWLLRLTVEILTILQPTVNPKLNIVVRKDFFASSITKHFYLSIAGKFYSKAKWKKVRDLSDYRHYYLAAVGDEAAYLWDQNPLGYTGEELTVRVRFGLDEACPSIQVICI